MGTDGHVARCEYLLRFISGEGDILLHLAAERGADVDESWACLLYTSFKPGEVTPELALEIAREFAAEHLPGYQAVIGVHVDKEHILSLIHI